MSGKYFEQLQEREALRIRVAIARGWRFCLDGQHENSTRYWQVYAPNATAPMADGLRWGENNLRGAHGYIASKLPRWESDLNAVWELASDLMEPYEFSSDPKEQAQLIAEQWLRENESNDND